MSNDTNDKSATVQQLPGGTMRVQFAPATPPADQVVRDGPPTSRGAPSGGSFNFYTGEYRTHEITRASTKDLANGYSGLLATAKTPSGRPATELTDDTRVTIQGCEMRIGQAVQAGLLTRTQGGHYAEPTTSLQIAAQPVRVDPVDASLSALERRLGPSIATRITETILRNGTLDSIPASDYAYAGLTKEQFETLAAPVFARTEQRVNQVTGGTHLTECLYHWCEGDPERSAELGKAIREIHHLQDSRRLENLLQKLSSYVAKGTDA